MRVKCIHNKHLENHITQDKIYDVIREEANSYMIIDNDGDRLPYIKKWFEIVEEKPVEEIMKVKCIDSGETGNVLELGGIYEVKEYGGHSYTVEDDPLNFKWSRSRFEIVEEKTFKHTHLYYSYLDEHNRNLCEELLRNIGLEEFEEYHHTQQHNKASIFIGDQEVF